MRNGVSLSELRTLTLDDAAAILGLIQAAATEETQELNRFIRSPNGAKFPMSVDPFQVGKLY